MLSSSEELDIPHVSKPMFHKAVASMPSVKCVVTCSSCWCYQGLIIASFCRAAVWFGITVSKTAPAQEMQWIVLEWALSKQMLIYLEGPLPWWQLESFAVHLKKLELNCPICTLLEWDLKATHQLLPVRALPGGTITSWHCYQLCSNDEHYSLFIFRV